MKRTAGVLAGLSLRKLIEQYFCRSVSENCRIGSTAFSCYSQHNNLMPSDFFEFMNT